MVAAFGDRTRALVDIQMDGNFTKVLVADGTDLQKDVTALVLHGVCVDILHHGDVYFPPRHVVMTSDERGHGWIVGWDAAEEDFCFVARGLYPSPGAGSPATVQQDIRSCCVVRVRADQLRPAAAVEAVKAFLRNRSLRGGLSSSGNQVVEVESMLLPAPWSTQMPGAHFEQLRGHCVKKTGPWMYSISVPGDMGRLFAAWMIFPHMDVFAPETWDISAAIPSLEACKRLRDGMPGV